MRFDDASGYPSLIAAVEALRTVIGVTREQIDRLDREPQALDDTDHLGAPAGCTDMLSFYLSRERLTPTWRALGHGEALPQALGEPWMMISTRRFCCRPAAVALLATGTASPIPTAVTRDGSIPAAIRAARTEAARRWDRASL
jgi:hypothetical protein